MGLDEKTAERAISELTSAANVSALPPGHCELSAARRLALQIAEASFGAESLDASFARFALASQLQEAAHSYEEPSDVAIPDAKQNASDAATAELWQEADALLADNLRYVEWRTPKGHVAIASSLYWLANHRVCGPTPLSGEPIVERLGALVERFVKVRKKFGPLLPGLRAALARERQDPKAIERAARDLVRAVEAEGGTDSADYVVAVIGLAETLSSLGRHDEAVCTIELVHARARSRELTDEAGVPMLVWVWRALATVEHSRGRVDVALHHLDACERALRGCSAYVSLGRELTLLRERFRDAGAASGP